MRKQLFALGFFLSMAFLVRSQSSTANGKLSEQTARFANTHSLEARRAAVEAQPDSLSLHLRFIKAFQESIPNVNFENADSVISLLEPQYAAWMTRFPGSAAVPLAIGDAYCSAESPKAKPYLLKAAALDPGLAKTWEDLAMDAMLWGDAGAERGYWKSAVDADTASADYAFDYAWSFQLSDPAQYRQLSLDVVKNFPNSERGAQALFWLALRGAKDQNDKVAIYEQLKNAYPPELFDWSLYGMSDYDDLLLEKDPAKAVALTQYMTGLNLAANEKKEWIDRMALAKKVAGARAALDEHRPVEALALLNGVQVSRWSSAREPILLMKAEAADAAGRTVAAYDSLESFYAKTPFDQTRAAMIRYAAKLGKAAGDVDTDVRRLRAAAKRSAPSFVLAPYLAHDSISLSDYRGKVLLLTFWFPGCGPCRDEFHYFQGAIDRFKGQPVAFVGININPVQDAYVVPFMRSSGYGFTPLHDKGDLTQKAYSVRAAPTSFLIDTQGRIAFSDLMVRDEKSRRMLELMIGSLLDPQPADH